VFASLRVVVSSHRATASHSPLFRDQWHSLFTIPNIRKRRRYVVEDDN
jgi:hypothetical protein